MYPICWDLGNAAPLINRQERQLSRATVGCLLTRNRQKIIDRADFGFDFGSIVLIVVGRVICFCFCFVCPSNDRTAVQPKATFCRQVLECCQTTGDGWAMLLAREMLLTVLTVLVGFQLVIQKYLFLLCN